MGTIGNIFNMNDGQKKAVAEITNSKQAAISIRTSIQYFNARTDYLKHKDIPVENREDYVPSKEEVKALK